MMLSRTATIIKYCDNNKINKATTTNRDDRFDVNNKLWKFYSGSFFRG